MIYTTEMVTNAVETAVQGARITARREERERLCRVIAAHAAIETSEAARESLWEVIRQIRSEDVSS